MLRANSIDCPTLQPTWYDSKLISFLPQVHWRPALPSRPPAQSRLFSFGVAMGLVDSLARPGGNATGLTQYSVELSGKRLELLKEAFPNVGRVALLWSSPVEGRQLTEAQNAAKALGLTLQSLDVRQLDDFDRVFEAAKKEGAHAFAVAPSPII